MDVTPVFQIEVEPWGAASIVRTVNDRVYIYSCSVRSDEYMCDKKHVFVHDSNFKKLHQSKYCGVLIDNRADAPICILEDKDIETNLNLRHDVIVFGGLCTVEYVYKINPC